MNYLFLVISVTVLINLTDPLYAANAKLNVNSENKGTIGISFKIPFGRKYNFDKELDELIKEAQDKQRKHPRFDLKYRIDPSALKNKLLKKLDYYYRFPEHHKRYRIHRSEKEVMNSIRKARGFKRYKKFKKIDNLKKLRKIILRNLNIAFLYADLKKIKPIVKLSWQNKKRNFIKKKLIFADKHVGEFEVLMLQPIKKQDKYPVIICLPGHAQSADEFIKKYWIDYLIEKGFAVWVLNFRAMSLTQVEYIISKRLMMHGFSLMGIRVYETLLLINYINNFYPIDKNKIVLMSHAGGGAVASLICRLEESIKAQITDAESDFISLTDFYGIHCETVPELARYAPIINDKKGQFIPKLKLPYDFKNSRRTVINFLKKLNFIK